jgi:broad specificity phosphatase PhoE
MTTLILIRHGETEGNVQQVWHGALDAPLTARGQAQVQATAQRMVELAKQYPIDIFYVSPLPRAHSTASAIASAINAELISEDGLREFSLGDWEGRTFLDLKEREQLWERWRVDPWFTPPNGESPGSFNQRAVAALQNLTNRHPGQTILAVTHSGVICTVLATWLGGHPEDWQHWEPHNCAITILRANDDGWQPILVNDVSHLPVEVIVNDKPVYA